jgi:chromosome segregation ATPase
VAQVERDAGTREQIRLLAESNMQQAEEIARLTKERDSLVFEMEGWKQKNRQDNEYLLDQVARLREDFRITQSALADAQDTVARLRAALQALTNCVQVSLNIMRGLEDDPEAVKVSMAKLEYGMYEARAALRAGAP